MTGSASPSGGAPSRSIASRAAGIVGRRSFAVAKVLAMHDLRRRPRPPLVVFTMGKTASTAVAHAVSGASGRRAFQVFRLDPVQLAEAERRYRARDLHARRRALGVRGFPGALHLWEAQALLEHPPSPACRWDVVTIVREPIAQAVSAFFHAEGQVGRVDGVPTDELVERFAASRYWRAPLRWFDREFRPALGVDVYEHRFDPGAGSSIIETPAVRVFVVRQEDLARAGAPIATFLGLTRPVEIRPRNQAADRGYAAAYRAFLAEARLPEELVRSVHSSRYAQHFYGGTDLAGLGARWLRASASPLPRSGVD
jgi:hypothetical protein